uniref:Immunoglobulin superfamily member 22 n=1 Tax=Salarias fasciatus TaxID=181472 RepID=A0A672I8L5_SALFA
MDSTKTSITLGWSKPEWDGGSEVTSYMVEKLVEGEAEWAMLTSKGEVKTTEFTVHDLKPSINYFFRVSAVNSAGRGEPLEMTEPVQAKDILGKQNTFSKTNEMACSEAQIDSDVAMRTHYIVKAGKDVELSVPLKGRPAPTASWSKGEECIDRDPKYEFHHSDTATVLVMREVTRLDTGKYTVKIENGVGEPKTLTLSVKVQDTPAMCRNLVLKDVTRGKVTLCWEPPLLDGGAEITNYVIEKRDSSKRSYSSVTSKCTETTYTIEDLSEKTSYFFRVLAENENGVGDPCETVDPVKATETPGPVKDISMKDSSKTSVTLQWLKPDYDGGSIISDYVIEKKVKGEEWSLGGTSKQCEFEVKKLKEHSDVFFRVAARNEKGQGEFVETGAIKVIDYIITPEADLSEYPNNTFKTRLGHNVHIELPYKGKPRPAVLWLKDSLPLKESDQIRFKTTGSKATLMIKNVTKENEGKYTLTLDNKVNRKSFHIHIVTLGPPSKPVGPINLDEVRAESIMISWEEPNDDGGGYITCYTVEKRDASQTDWKMACSSVQETQYKICNLIKGHQYQFRVCAENRYGVSEPLLSQMVVAKHQFRPPGPPGKPVVDSITLKWDAPKRDGGSKITSYNIEKRQGQGRWFKANLTDCHECQYTVTGLATNERYEFRVTARNAIGVVSPPSNSSGLIVFGPEYFEGLTVKAGDSMRLKVTVTGRPTPKVVWYRDDVEVTRKMMDIITVTGSSTIFVRDADRSHRGLYTSILVQVQDTPGEPVGPITFSNISEGNLEWTKPVDDGGSDILGYIVEVAKGEEWERVNEELAVETSYTATGLKTGAEYNFRVAAVNQVGRGEEKELPEPAQAVDRFTPPQVDIDATFKQTHIVKAGGSVCLAVNFRGKPTPTATWVKEEGELGVLSEVSTVEGYSSLSIENCSRNDTGKYTVNLENSSGSDRLLDREEGEKQYLVGERKQDPLLRVLLCGGRSRGRSGVPVQGIRHEQRRAEQSQRGLEGSCGSEPCRSVSSQLHNFYLKL